MKALLAVISFFLFIAPSAVAQSLITPYSPFSKVELPSLPVSISFAGEDVPLSNYDVRESLQRELLVTCYMHSRTFLTLLNQKRYFSVIEPIIRRFGVPEDFKYLCMAESGLDPNIVSPAGAAGLWQIMPATGRSHGLEVGKEIDERFHVEKATEAACKYLLNSYRIFGSWTLVAAAYNLGDAGVSTRLEKQGVRSYYDAFLPSETLRYVFRILALKMVSSDPMMYGFSITGNDYYKPLADYTEIEVNGADIKWSELAAENGTNYKMLRQLNHWIRGYEFANKSGRTYILKIPCPEFRQPETGK